MKIGIIGHLKFPIAKPHAGGLEAFTDAYVRALIQRGHDVTLFASADSDRELPLEPIVDRGTVVDCVRRVGRIDHAWIDSVEDEAYENLMVKLADSDFDVIHNHSLSPIPLRFAALLPMEMVTTIQTSVLPRMSEELLQRGSRSCGHFVNISQSNEKSWQAFIEDQSVIFNGIDTEFWRYQPGPRSRRAVWLGRITPKKGTHLAIAAAHRAGLPIDVVGPVVDSDYFAEHVWPQLGRQDSYLGHRVQEDLCEIIGLASVALVTPCCDEPVGMAVAEALSCGTPVAGFARGALPEILVPSVGQLAYPGDVEGLAKATLDCLNLNREACSRLARQRFGFDRMVKQYESVYQSTKIGVAA
ncbi:glycosyltransferase family 4 protein [Roseiconus nitratireducens]|uniref:Glycosyltransferase family 4 protein n=1 Tax=Roseiconus nitratireducens TaxID=2605748 RepID=A0A5M6CVE9_9BACT|nr:glycosyltransferase family 4 protein [Roseiconus nitratireducens]KAA5539181.1 glycosyltransferase family 4 protein [Roseiconus nitratireducens]